MTSATEDKEREPSTLTEARAMLAAVRDELRSWRLIAKILHDEGNAWRGLFLAARRQRQST